MVNPLQIPPALEVLGKVVAWQGAAFTWHSLCWQRCLLIPPAKDSFTPSFQLEKCERTGTQGQLAAHVRAQQNTAVLLLLAHPSGAAHPAPTPSRSDADGVRRECQCSSHQQHGQNRGSICVCNCVTLLPEKHHPSPQPANRKIRDLLAHKYGGKELGKFDLNAFKKRKESQHSPKTRRLKSTSVTGNSHKYRLVLAES